MNEDLAKKYLWAVHEKSLSLRVPDHIVLCGIMALGNAIDRDDSNAIDFQLYVMASGQQFLALGKKVEEKIKNGNPLERAKALKDATPVSRILLGRYKPIYIRIANEIVGEGDIADFLVAAISNAIGEINAVLRKVKMKYLCEFVEFHFAEEIKLFQALNPSETVGGRPGSQLPG